MTESAEVVGLIGDELVSNQNGKGKREAVLALPLSRLLVRMARIPTEQESDILGFLTPILQAQSPYPDEPLTVGWETVRESERGRIVLAAALPESSADDIAEKLDAEKINVTRIDALVFGELRALWSSLAPAGELGAARRMLLLSSDSGGPRSVAAADDTEVVPPKADTPTNLELLVLDGDTPSAIRAIPAGADLRREAMLSLLEAEDFGGAAPLAEIVTVGAVDASPLAAFAPVRSVAPVSIQETLDAVAVRAADPDGLDARPESWREVLEETRFKAKVCRGIAAAVGVWLLAMGVLFGVPMAYGYMADYQKGLSKRHQKAYKQVCDMKGKALLVRKYSDHARGALEMMKAVADRLPDGVELESWDFKRADEEKHDGGVTFSGVADDPRAVYNLKDALTDLVDGDNKKVFGLVRLGRLAASKDKQKFTLECRYFAEEEE